jgi:hypothetical protein
LRDNRERRGIGRLAGWQRRQRTAADGAAVAPRLLRRGPAVPEPAGRWAPLPGCVPRLQHGRRMV